MTPFPPSSPRGVFEALCLRCGCPQAHQSRKGLGQHYLRNYAKSGCHPLIMCYSLYKVDKSKHTASAHSSSGNDKHTHNNICRGDSTSRDWRKPRAHHCAVDEQADALVGGAGCHLGPPQPRDDFRSFQLHFCFPFQVSCVLVSTPFKHYSQLFRVCISHLLPTGPAHLVYSDSHRQVGEQFALILFAWISKAVTKCACPSESTYTTLYAVTSGK